MGAATRCPAVGRSRRVLKKQSASLGYKAPWIAEKFRVASTSQLVRLREVPSAGVDVAQKKAPTAKGLRWIMSEGSLRRSVGRNKDHAEHVQRRQRSR